jgi:hypothetical protein
MRSFTASDYSFRIFKHFFLQHTSVNTAHRTVYESLVEFHDRTSYNSKSLEHEPTTTSEYQAAEDMYVHNGDLIVDRFKH